jgi:hypothetical protein
MILRCAHFWTMPRYASFQSIAWSLMDVRQVDCIGRVPGASQNGFGQHSFFSAVARRFCDGRTDWLCSANFTNASFDTNWEMSPPGSQYAICLQKVCLL